MVKPPLRYTAVASISIGSSRRAATQDAAAGEGELLRLVDHPRAAAGDLADDLEVSEGSNPAKLALTRHVASPPGTCADGAPGRGRGA